MGAEQAEDIKQRIRTAIGGAVVLLMWAGVSTLHLIAGLGRSLMAVLGLAAGYTTSSPDSTARPTLEARDFHIRLRIQGPSPP
ncbi:MAG: hypothetical protein PVF51_11545 [Nitrospirota bacterium]|jgi:hypothetical protein